jgi:hypothetical protein
MPENPFQSQRLKESIQFPEGQNQDGTFFINHSNLRRLVFGTMYFKIW